MTTRDALASNALPLAFVRPSRGIPGAVLLVLSALCLVGVSCMTPAEPKVTAEDVRAAADAGQLPSLYEQIQVELQSPDVSEKERAELTLRLEDAGRRLGAATESEIAASLATSRLPSGEVPLSAFSSLDARMTKLERWSPATYARVAQDLEAEKRITEQAIAAKQAELAQLSEQQVPEKLALFDEIGILNGPGSPAQVAYAEKRDAAVAALRRDASTALENEQYGEAQRMLSIVARVEPSDPSIEGDLEEIDAKLFEQRFYDALEHNQPDTAYQALVTLSEAENFEKVKPRLKDSGDVMADYFVALALGATESGDLVSAYRWFGQATDIQTRLGLAPAAEVPEVEGFVTEMQRRHALAMEKGLYGVAWGYLQVIGELEAAGPALRRKERESHEEVLKHAVKRLSVAPFEDSHETGASYGDTLTAKLVQYLFENSGDDVRIIEREKLDAIKAELSLKGGGDEGLVAVDFLVEGNILEAKVDSSERRGKKITRVVVEKEIVPNPAWERWASATASQRKEQGLVQPAQRSLVQEKKEDVEIGITNHRKVGVFSVSYRMIDAESAKVLFADTQREKSEVEDTSSDGVSLGEFQQEFKVAKLPTDIELLDGLADDISSAIGARLAEVLASPETRYEKAGDRFVREGNYLDAAQQFAYATVLGDRKGADTAALREKLEKAVVAAHVD